MVQGLQRRFVKVVRSLLSWEVEHESGESGLDKQAEEAAAGQASISGSIKIGHLAALQGHLAARPGLDLLSYRGSLGESSLHWAYLYNQPAIAHFLMEKEPRLVRSFYNGAYFRGENALHVTIACKQGDEARLLLGLEPDLLYSRAEGIFFHRGAAAYYGEYPLSFAVSTNQADIVRMLVVEKGAWISAGDLHGNTAAHLAVHHDRYEVRCETGAIWPLLRKPSARHTARFTRYLLSSLLRFLRTLSGWLVPADVRAAGGPVEQGLRPPAPAR